MHCFETTGVIDETVTQEVYAHMLSKERRYGLIGCIVVPAVLAIVCVMWSYETLGAVAFTAAALITYYAYIVRRQGVQISIARLRESYDSEEYRVTTWFDESGITTQNHVTNGVGSIRSAHYSRIVETKRLFILFTKANQITIVFKDCLDEAEQAAFISFLKGNFPNLQYELKRKR